jgi:carboxymethylenebutenolidase
LNEPLAEVTGVGIEALTDFYARHFIGHWPADTVIVPVCRTVGSDLVDEMTMTFAHDVAVPAFLPNIAPTGRPVRLPVVVVMVIGAGKVACECIDWDRASLLAQSACSMRHGCRSPARSRRTRCSTRTCPPTRCCAVEQAVGA